MPSPIVAIVALWATCWAPPVDAPVTDPFRLPPCTWCAGNRGLEYATTAGTVVRSVERGVVTFAGSVAGVRYVTVRHQDGVRATYGQLATVRVRRGAPVAAGTPIGTTGRRFYFGLREGDLPIDPAPFLGRWVRRPRLVPLDGSGGMPSPPRLICRNTTATG